MESESLSIGPDDIGGLDVFMRLPEETRHNLMEIWATIEARIQHPDVRAAVAAAREEAYHVLSEALERFDQGPEQLEDPHIARFYRYLVVEDEEEQQKAQELREAFALRLAAKRIPDWWRDRQR